MISLKEMKSWRRVPLIHPQESIKLLLGHFPKMQTHFPFTIASADFEGFKDWSLVWPEEQKGLEFLAIEYTPVAAVNSTPLMIKSSVFTSHRSGSSGDLDPLIKSLWGKKYSSSHLPELVVDGTAGLLGDSFKMVPFTKRILAFERNKLLQLLIAHYVSYVQEIHDSTSPKIQFSASEISREILQNHEDLSRPWILYLDPMFESKEKSMASGPIQILKQLTQMDGVVDWNNLFAQFQFVTNLEKIVVKRWSKAPYLFSKTPTYQLESKLVRYDVYQL